MFQGSDAARIKSGSSKGEQKKKSSAGIVRKEDKTPEVSPFFMSIYIMMHSKICNEKFKVKMEYFDDSVLKNVPTSEFEFHEMYL